MAKLIINHVAHLVGLLLLIQTLLVQSSPLKPTKTSRFSDLFNLRNGDVRFKRNQDTGSTCGYQSCPETEASKLNVHIIAHTHDDVGWLKTVDQYYYGTRKANSQIGVQYILDSLIPQLLMDRDKRFIYVEMSFFSKWWAEQDEDMRRVVRQLVDEGRLEFINGGWCMNDEATVSYSSTIEQMTLGLRFLNESFGKCGHPKVGWQIDPFGHSSEQASLFAQFGFDGMFFTRIGYLDKEKRAESKSLDMIWHGDRALPAQSGSIFTNVFRDGYDAPNGFCFDAHCNDDVIVDNKKSYEYNLEQRGQYMINFLRHYASAKLTNQLLVPFGGDFQYSAAGQNFKSLDKLMKYISENAPDMNIFYSTPSCYQYAVHDYVRDKKIKLPEKYDDFMPYDSSSTVWWSGYFTSRPSVKLIERETANLLQAARLISLTSLIDQAKQVAQAHMNNTSNGSNNNNKRQQKSGAAATTTTAQQQRPNVPVERVRAHEEECLMPLWEILGDLQHHDAVTGTEKQHVANDYVRRATDAGQMCAKFLGQHGRAQFELELDKTLAEHKRLVESAQRLELQDPIFLEETRFCSLNISQCEPLEIPVDVCYYQTKFEQADLAASCAKTASMYRVNLSRRNRAVARELERKGVLVRAYNPLASEAKNVDFRLPCIGRCDLDKVQVIHVASNETIKPTRLPLPSGVDSLPFRDSQTKYELLFYGNVPALGGTTFVVSDSNEDDFVDDEEIISTTSERRNKRNSALSEACAQNDDCDHCEHMQGAQFEEEISIPTGISGSRFNEPSGLMSGQQGRNKSTATSKRPKRNDESLNGSNSGNSGGLSSDRVVVKFDLQTGMIVGLKRLSDGSFLNITQKFGTYAPADIGHPPGAYIFRPNASEPRLLHKPATFKMVKRNNGSLIEIHQKWTDWIWQTIRVDGRKNFIEFDYVVGPIPIVAELGQEVVTRYITNMRNQGIFFTDSNGRQMMPRTKLHSVTAEQLGGSFFPVVSSMMIRSLRSAENDSTTNARNMDAGGKSAQAVAVLVDRAQAATSLNEGDLEFLIHRRHIADDQFGVGEALDEPGEDGRGLVTRGRHRLYLEFHNGAERRNVESPGPSEESRQLVDGVNQRRLAPRLFKLPRTPRANVTYALETMVTGAHASIAAGPNLTSGILPSSGKSFRLQSNESDVYLVHDQLMNELRQESIKSAFKPLLTFDRLRVSAHEFMQLLSRPERAEFSLLNNSLPDNVHLLTLQAWNRGPNELLIRLENLDNPLTLTQFPSRPVFKKLLNSYKAMASANDNDDTLAANEPCANQPRPDTRVDIQYLINNVRMVSLEEYNLGANVLLDYDERLDWTQERAELKNSSCDLSGDSPTTVKLSPRQIRTFLAKYEFI